MRKDFDRWNEVKQNLEDALRPPMFHEAEIWWCSVGINVGHEVCGKGITFCRPVLVVKKLSPTNFIGVPITSKIKTGSWYSEISIRQQIRTALLHQVRMYSGNRFQRKMATLNPDDLIKIKKELGGLLEL
jgi:mRNA interferase MazF